MFLLAIWSTDRVVSIEYKVSRTYKSVRHLRCVPTQWPKLPKHRVRRRSRTCSWSRSTAETADRTSPRASIEKEALRWCRKGWYPLHMCWRCTQPSSEQLKTQQTSSEALSLRDKIWASCHTRSATGLLCPHSDESGEVCCIRSHTCTTGIFEYVTARCVRNVGRHIILDTPSGSTCSTRRQ